MSEQWRDVPDWPGFQVSDEGRVRSNRLNGEWRIRSTPQRKNFPYPTIALTGNGGRKDTKCVHALVALAFIGPRPEGMEVRHLNGNPADNRLVNLAYGTHAENVADQLRHGTHPMASKTHCNRGHELSGDNLVSRSDGYRECATCKRENDAQRSLARSERRRQARLARGTCRHGHPTPLNENGYPIGRCLECGRLAARRYYNQQKERAA